VSAVFGYSQVCIFCFRRHLVLSRIRLVYHRSRYSHEPWTQRIIQTVTRVAVYHYSKYSTLR